MKQTNKIYTPLLYSAICISSALTLACAPIAFAQNAASKAESELEVITVTADLGQRNLSELPATALVLNETAITQRQARHLQDLIAMVPNLNFSAGSTRGKFIQIRGIGERSQFDAPINPSIGLILDDIDFSGIGALATVFDAQQVEVLSGPQSVATGINSLGGIVKIVTNRPTNTLYANLSASYAQYNEHRVSGVYSNALSSNTNARFSIQNTQSDGFVENAFTGKDDTNGIDETTATAMFDITLTDNTNLALNAYYFDIANAYDAFSLDNDNVTQSDQPGFDTADAHAVSAKLSHNFDTHLLQVTAYSLSADTLYGYDEDWTHPSFDPGTYASFDQYDRDYKRQGVDIKLASKPSNTSVASYLIGLNIATQDEDLLRIQTYSDTNYVSQYSPNSAAIYGQYTYPVNEKMRLTGAARFEQFDADFIDNKGYGAKVNDDLFAGVITIDYKIQQSFLFASVSRGYKAAGFNIDNRIEPENRSFAAEFNYNYEVGIKGRAYDGMANIHLTFFYMKRDDAQVSDAINFPEIDDNGTVFTSFAPGIGNSDTGVNQGIEFASTWDLADNWYIRANVGYLDATIGNYTQFDGTYVPKRDQAQAPKYSAYLASTWQISNALSWFIDADIKDDYRFSDDHNVRAPFTLVVNSELNWQIDQVSVQLWLKNVFDRQIYTRGFGSFPNDPRDGYSTFGPYYQFGQERQVGITLSYTWE